MKFPGRHSKLRSSSSEKFGKSQEFGGTLGLTRSQKNRRQTSGWTVKDPTKRAYRITSIISDPETRLETPNYVEGNRNASSRGIDQENFLTTSEPPPKTSETSKKYLKGPQEQIPQVNFQIGHG